MPSDVVDEVANVATAVVKEENEDQAMNLLMALAGIMAAVWLSAETIATQLSRATQWKFGWGVEKSAVALPMGVIAAGFAWWFGWIKLGDGVAGCAGALFFGLIAAGLAGGLHRQAKQAVTGVYEGGE